MKYFLNEFHGKRIILVNFKVGYTLIKESGCLSSNWAHAFLRKHLSKSPTRLLMLVRNPFDRVESLYKEKLIKLPGEHKGEHWPVYLRKIMENMECGIDVNEHFSSQREKIRRIDFESFVTKILPSTYLLDPHSHPQTYNVHLSSLGVTGWLKPVTFDLNETDQMQEFSKITGICTKIKRNSTTFFNNNFHYTQQMIDVIQEIYADDFHILGYPPKTPHATCAGSQNLKKMF